MNGRQIVPGNATRIAVGQAKRRAGGEVVRSKRKGQNKVLILVLSLLLIFSLFGQATSEEVDDETLQAIMASLDILDIYESSLRLILESDYVLVPDVAPDTTVFGIVSDGLKVGYVLDHETPSSG
jgi:hypothetical protein